MMRKLFLLLLPFLLLISCAPELEEVIEEAYSDGSPQRVVYYQDNDGFREMVKVVAYYEDGSMRYEGEFAGEKRNGHWIYWYENGNKWSDGYFKDDLRDGYGTTWHENGKKHYEGSYKDGVRSGLWKFYNEEGELLKEINYDE